MSHFHNLPFFIAFWVPDVSMPPLDNRSGANRWAASDSRKRCPSLDQRTLSRHNFKAGFTALNYTVIRVLVNTDKGYDVIIANMTATTWNAHDISAIVSIVSTSDLVADCVHTT